MKRRICFFVITLFLIGRTGVAAQVFSFDQMDSPQTLYWVERQSIRIDSLLNDAMLSSEPFEILLRLTDCYQVFDAVSMAGLYCTNVRAAAEAGRNYCDIINYRLEKDLNSKLQRAVEARRQGVRMKEAAKSCNQPGRSSEVEKAFVPKDLVVHEAHMVELDLLDGLASENMHIMSQKLELAIRTLYELEHLARSLSDCDATLDAAEKAVISCQNALVAPNWTELNRAIKTALFYVQGIQQSTTCN
jgi:hypothetical protein